ncbi:hypothetical protein FF1_028143 [Malus domestica]|uniref:Uncharacterized protein n=1 Tax=Malus domestica TaxID=3750 RepID=A0A498KF41_MALDO|nr:hypothetical protein DVH24_006271 [Malus domestica]
MKSMIRKIKFGDILKSLKSGKLFFSAIHRLYWRNLRAQETILVNSKIEGSQATAKQTAELIRSVISAQRVPYTNQAGALIYAVKAVGEQLIAANPIGNVL